MSKSVGSNLGPKGLVGLMGPMGLMGLMSLKKNLQWPFYSLQILFFSAFPPFFLFFKSSFPFL